MPKHAEGLTVAQYCKKFESLIFYRTIINGRVDTYTLKQVERDNPEEYARVISMWERTRFYPYRLHEEKGEGEKDG